MNEVLAAILGALLGGILQIVHKICTDKKENESLVRAIGCEVDAIIRLIQHRRYFEFIEEFIEISKNGNPTSIVIDVRSNYFHIYESLGDKIGRLDKKFVIKVVNFYSYCKSAIDSTRVDGFNEKIISQHENIRHLEELRDILTAIMQLGDEIVLYSGVRDDVALRKSAK